MKERNVKSRSLGFLEWDKGQSRTSPKQHSFSLTLGGCLLAGSFLYT